MGQLWYSTVTHFLLHDHAYHVMILEFHVPVAPCTTTPKTISSARLFT